MRRWHSVPLGAVLMLVIGCGGPDPPASDGTEEMAVVSLDVAPATSLNAVMVGLVDHAAHHIWDLGREGMAPTSNLEWEEVQHHSIQLIAAGSYITLGGTGRMDATWVAEPRWAGWAQAVSDAGVLALDAANQRDLDGVLAAGDSLIVACEGCHQEFKLALPTEGIEHPHHYY